MPAPGQLSYHASPCPDFKSSLSSHYKAPASPPAARCSDVATPPDPPCRVQPAQHSSLQVFQHLRSNSPQTQAPLNLCSFLNLLSPQLPSPVRPWEWGEAGMAGGSGRSKQFGQNCTSLLLPLVLETTPHSHQKRKFWPCHRVGKGSQCPRNCQRF